MWETYLFDIRSSNDKYVLHYHSFKWFMEHFKVKPKYQQIKRFVSIIRDKKDHILDINRILKKYYCGN